MAASRSDIGTPAALVDRARASATDLVAGVRRWSRFARMRAAIVGAWAVLAAATLWGACPSSGPTNPLGADVQVLADSLVGGEQVLVRNDSGEIWTDVRLTLDDGWRHERRTLRPEDPIVLSMSQFRRDGDAAPSDFRPHTLTIECEQGRHTFVLK